ncbi:hypothetical protein SAMN04487965_3204 [Microbulbifer donghaiensis]|uniref:Uncharacterized protein n=2 Tax=Microbulbifer donghaiensis TaxID=494016 RepID=A0A1M5GP41_9GAMM|nr:hypothetical protein SAMN04487965_3204 [Microbulbifer donghaiensis]
MAVTRYCSLLMAGLVMFGGSGAIAQTQASLTAEKNRLARMEQSLENRMVEVEDIENELLSYEYKLERAQESLDKARKHYDESRVELQKAERDHQLKSDSDTERQLNKAKHGFAMAERGVDSRNRRVEFIQTNYDELKAQLDAEQKAISQTKSRISAQEAKVEQMVNTMLAKAEAAQRAAAVKRAAPVSKPELPEPTVAAIEAAPAPKEVVAEPAAPAQEVDPELLDYVKRERARLDKLLAEQSDEGKHTFRNLELRPSRGEALPFEFLGQNQYRLVATVEAGRQTYKINTWKFRRTIPADDDGARYVFIFDARRLSRPRLVMYPEYVLSKLD